MNADEAAAQARAALAHRLRMWAVESPELKAADFMAGLQGAGWLWMSPANRPAPPRAGQECDLHVGEWAERCRACAADKLAGVTTDRPTQRPENVSERIQQLRQHIACEERPEPAPEPEVAPDPNVARLREAISTPEPEPIEETLK